MRHSLIMIFLMASLPIFAACHHGSDKTVRIANGQNDQVQDTTENVMKISIGSKTFTATLADNKTVTALKELLPLTASMDDLNGNETYYRLPSSLPTDTFSPGTIHEGDILLWQSNTIVLFYKTFSTSYSYTRIGYISDVSGLAEAVGPGSITVNFENK